MNFLRSNTPRTRNGMHDPAHDSNEQDYLLMINREYTAWLGSFLSFFFTRMSVMLFVLRLLPPYKVWQHRTIYGIFVLNILITALASISYGVACIPFRALWVAEVPGAKCYSKKLLVLAARLNGSKLSNYYPIVRTRETKLMRFLA